MCNKHLQIDRPRGDTILLVSLCQSRSLTLHATGASDLTIQIRLRWKSLTFKDYLRQVQQVADGHNIEINRVFQDNIA